MASKFRNLPLVFALVLFLTGVAIGQERAGGVEGTLRDPNGAVVPGVEVTLTSTANRTEGARSDSTTGFTRTVTTDDDGFFRILEVPPGFYSLISAATAGFGEVTVNNIEVVLGRNTPVNVTLAVGGTATTVDVVAGGSAIDTTDSKIQTNITEQVIELIPKGTNFSSALQVSPATRNEPLSGGFQIDGASGSENTFIIDGQEVTNFRTGTLNANNNIPFQFVQEIQVKSNGFEAEFGGATGGVINVVTKGGSNDFNGEFGLQFETSKLFARTIRSGTADATGAFASGSSATGFASPVIQAATPGTLTYLQPQRDAFLNTLPTATLGGPIFKDRLYFFASYTPQQLNTNRTFTFADGTSNTYRQRIRQDYAFLRLDGNITDRLRLFGSYTYNPRDIRGIFPTFTSLFGTGATANAPSVSPTPAGLTPLAERGGRVNAQNFSFSGVYTPTDKLVISARAGRGFLNEKADAYGVPNVLRLRCTFVPAAFLGISGCPSEGFQNVPNNSSTTRDVSIRNTVDVDASYLVSDFFGRHQFKGGFQSNRLSNDVSNGYFDRGQILFNYGQSIADTDSPGSPSRGQNPGEVGYGRLVRIGAVGKVSSKNEALYIQDTYQPVNRLSLNLGLRIERENVPPFNNGPGISFGFGDKLAPRLGAAFDVTGSGRFKVFGSFGRFFDRFKYELPRGSFGGEQFLNDYFVIPANNANFSQFTLDYALANSFLQTNSRVPSNVGIVDPVTGQTLTTSIDPDLQAVRQTEFTVGSELGVTRDIVFAARFTRKKLDRTIEDVGIRDAGGNETYFIANPGFGIVAREIIPGVPQTPKAERQYDALEVRVDKRFTRNYYVNASYTLSRLFGNYGGLANSDEAGRTSPNVNRVFDLPYESFTANGEPNNGRLSTDRPHVFKAFAAYDFNYFGRLGNNSSTFSGFTTVQSGTPITSRVDLFTVDTVVLNTRGDLGRLEKFTQTDFAFTHRYRFGNDNRFQVAFDVNILNVFNESNELSRYDLVSLTNVDESLLFTRVARRDAAGNYVDVRGNVIANPVGSSAVVFDSGGTDTQGIQSIFTSGTRDRIQNLLTNAVDLRSAADRAAGIGVAQTDPLTLDARFNQPDLFQVPRQVRFGFRFIF